ncbi:hypothetical protein ASA1KI_19830 [Opitutales bacterium ASA1]|uniref:hypothetical protein n=1 Tax=Congregicoccus parvus TaxID=3081749 RepID=UPI002B320873|nr:hypothetical protein ASA1KI_19830 [Opitutales bacterium ASA1]
MRRGGGALLAGVLVCAVLARGEAATTVVRLCALDRVEGALVFDDGGQERRVFVPLQRRSDAMPIAGGSRLVFERAEETGEGHAGAAAGTRRAVSGDVRREPVAVTTLPGDVRRPLLVFEAAPSRGEGKFNVHVLEDAWSAFPARTVRVANLSTLRMAAAVSGREFVIEPGATESVPIEREDATHVSVKLAVEGPEGWSVDYDGVHQVLPRMRFLFVCRAVPDAEKGVALRTALLRDHEPSSAQLQR